MLLEIMLEQHGNGLVKLEDHYSERCTSVSNGRIWGFILNIIWHIYQMVKLKDLGTHLNDCIVMIFYSYNMCDW
jgi:hypothetical protein